jgi:transposase
MVDHWCMKAYSKDLRQKVVQAVQQRGMPKSQAARLFGISLSSVKRYSRLASQGESLTPRKGGGRPPKTDEATKRLLEEDIRRKPAATVADRRHFLESFTGKSLSEPTLRRLLKRMGFSRKKDCGGDGTRRVAEGRLESDTRPTDRSKAAGVRGRDGHQHLTCSSASLVA